MPRFCGRFLEAADAQTYDREAELVGIQLAQGLNGYLAHAIQTVRPRRIQRTCAMTRGIEAGDAITAGQHHTSASHTPRCFQDMVGARHVRLQEIGKRRLIRQPAQVKHRIDTGQRRLHSCRIPQIDDVHLFRFRLRPEWNTVQQDQPIRIVS
ncbi:hypothetical protein ASE41_32655 [Streptomyces sp. Root264]|nr:hypothetical protein ASE41_32655 [Streptomyces sp. Root264]